MRPTANSIMKSFQKSNKKHILITGNRGSGKTTLFTKLKEELCAINGCKIPEIKTYLVPKEKVMLRNVLTGEEDIIGIFENDWMKTVPSGFQNLGVRIVKEAIAFTDSDWSSIDEIGFLESNEKDFKDAIRAMFEAKRVLAVIRKQDLPFLNELKDRKDVYLIDTDEMYLQIGCVIMASGISKRFGENKLLAEFQGETLMERVLRLTDERCFTRRLVVTRTKEVAALCKEQGIDVVLHEYPGRGDAIKLGIEQMMDMDGCLFCPCDQPFLRGESLRNLVKAFCENGKGIFRMKWQEEPGAPVLFSKEYFQELVNLPSDKGGSYVMKNHNEDIRFIQAVNKNELKDIDTREDLERLLNT